jgi:hypothetical protein
MTIQEKINDLNKYFITQICDNNFDLIRIDEYVAKINITDGDDVFEFNVWYCIGVDYIRTYEGHLNAITLSFTDSQKRLVFDMFQKMWDSHKRDILIMKRDQALEGLKELDK